MLISESTTQATQDSGMRKSDTVPRNVASFFMLCEC